MLSRTDYRTRLAGLSERHVRVIHLRKRISNKDRKKTAGQPAQDVQWSCSWVARGHWREQPYPSLGITRSIWILPVVKGDKSKPAYLQP